MRVCIPLSKVCGACKTVVAEVEPSCRYPESRGTAVRATEEFATSPPRDGTSRALARQRVGTPKARAHKHTLDVPRASRPPLLHRRDMHSAVGHVPTAYSSFHVSSVPWRRIARTGKYLLTARALAPFVLDCVTVPPQQGAAAPRLAFDHSVTSNIGMGGRPYLIIESNGREEWVNAAPPVLPVWLTQAETSQICHDRHKFACHRLARVSSHRFPHAHQRHDAHAPCAARYRQTCRASSEQRAAVARLLRLVLGRHDVQPCRVRRRRHAVPGGKPPCGPRRPCRRG